MIAALALALVAISLLTQAQGTIDLRDESYHWYGAIEVTRGKVPIRDFQAYDPGRYYWVAPWLALLGPGIVPFRIACSAFHFPGVLCGLLVLRRLTRSWSVLVPAGALLTVWLLPQYQPSHTVALVGVWLAVLLIEHPSSFRHLLAGVFIGLAAFFGRNLGVYALVSFGLVVGMVWWRLERRDLVRRVLALGSGIVVGYSPMLVMFLLAPGLWTVNVYALRALAESGRTNLALPVPWPWRASSLWEASVGVFFVLLPLFLALSVAWVLRAKRDELLRSRVLVAATLVGFPYVHYAFSRADVQHLGMSIHPFLLGMLTLPFVVARRWRALAIGLVVGVGALSLVAAGQLNALYQRAIAPPGRLVAAKVGGWTVWMPLPMATFIDGTARFNASMVRPDEGFLIVPHIGPGMYAILNRESPLWQSYFLQPQPEWWQQPMIDELERNHVDWVLLDDVRGDGHEELRFRHTHRLIWEYIEREFDVFPVDGLPKDMVLLRRRTAPGATP